MQRASLSSQASTSSAHLPQSYASPPGPSSSGASTPAGAPRGLVTPYAQALANEQVGFFDGHLGEYFMGEVVDQVSAAAKVSLARTQRQRRLLESQMTPYGLPPPPPPTGKASVEGPSADEVEEAFGARMDAMGYRVGWVMAERLCRDRPRFPQAAHSSIQATGSGVVNPVGVSDTLEIVKFVCKDLWQALYQKQIDNLRTNHRGTYVLQDHAFRPFLRLSGPTGSAGREADAMSKRLTPFPVGVIRGALSNLGIASTVHAEPAQGPSCTFQIRTK